MSTPSGNTVAITDAGPSRKKLTITIPADTVTARLRESYETLVHDAVLPGFRRGRAPRQLLEKRFGSTIRSETKNQLVASAYAEAVQSHELKILGDPSSDSLATIEIVEGKDLTFDLDVEVLPEFELPPLEGIAVRKPIIEVTDEMVAKELEKLQLNEGSLDPRESPEPGDYLTGHGIMTGPDGVEYYNIRGAVVQVPTPDKQGKGMILGIMVDDFAKQLGLPKPGETVTIKAKGPQNHEIERLRGADLTMTFQVERADRINPAEAATLALGFGFPSEDALKDEIRSRLEGRAKVEQVTLMRQQVARNLIDSTEIELPQKMTERQAERNLQRRRFELMYRGIDARHIEEQISDLRNASQSTASRELKLYFILHRAAEELKINVTEADVNARIAQMAAQRRERPEKLRQELIQSNQIGSVFQQVREHKTLDAVLAKAQVEDISAEEFEKKFAEEK